MSVKDIAELKDKDLLSCTLESAQFEKLATLQLLSFLFEVDERRVYASLHYSTLFEYCVSQLKFSESTAAERVRAVRLMRAVPEIKTHIEDGSLSLSNAAQIQRFIRTEDKVSPPGEKIDAQTKSQIVNACLGKSKREVQKTLLARQSEPARQLSEERIKLVEPERSEIRFTVDEKIIQKLERLKQLTEVISLEKVFDEALDLLIAREEKKLGLNNSASVRNKAAGKSSGTSEFVASSDKTASRFIPIHLKQLVFTRSGGQCEFVSEKTKLRCSSRFRLQIDHVYPFALGGKTEASNLRNLCRNHNLRVAQEYGLARPARH